MSVCMSLVCYFSSLQCIKRYNTNKKLLFSSAPGGNECSRATQASPDGLEDIRATGNLRRSIVPNYQPSPNSRVSDYSAH